MIRYHLARLMGERKMRISDVMRETGLSRTTVTLLYKDYVLTQQLGNRVKELEKRYSEPLPVHLKAMGLEWA